MRVIDQRAVTAICVAVLLPVAGCRQAGSGTGGEAAMFTDDHGVLTVPASSPLRTHLTVQPVGVAGDGATLDLPATVEADPARIDNVVTPLTGRVLALKVGLGARVKKEQVLAIITSGDFAQAQADNEKARDAFDLAKKALERARGVKAAGGASDKDLEAVQSIYNQAEAELARTRARLFSLNGGAAGRSRDLVLTAPQSGVVTTLAVAAGAQVNDPTATLMTVSNLDVVFVTANVAERDIGKVGIGTNADIALTTYPGQTLHGRITEVNPTVESDTRRQKVRIALPNGDGRLLPNMYATVRLPIPSAGAISVPQSALIMNNDVISVLVEVRPWVFRRQAVQIGDETEAAAHVIRGLMGGERVVVRGGVLLSD